VSGAIMPKDIVRTIFKLLAASLVVGLVMHWFDITPRTLVAHFGETVERLFREMASFAGWAIDYVLIGAVIVVPIWLIGFLLKRVQGKRGG
jgi:hypothetical protein